MELFKINDWEVIESPYSVLEKNGPMVFRSLWLNTNLLVFDPKTVTLEASEHPTRELLDRKSFDVVSVPFYDVATFGGGLHCGTDDVYREGRRGAGGLFTKTDPWFLSVGYQ